MTAPPPQPTPEELEHRRAEAEARRQSAARREWRRQKSRDLGAAAKNRAATTDGNLAREFAAAEKREIRKARRLVRG